MRNWIPLAVVLLIVGTLNTARGQTSQPVTLEQRMQIRRAPQMAQDSAVTAQQEAQGVRIEAPRRLVEATVARPSAKTEKAAFLGLATSPVPVALREQLKLKKGVGLVVEQVEKDSPAEQAGIKQYDVLEKLDDQWLVNVQQLVVLVRLHQAGDSIALSLIRQGQPQSTNVKLVEKDQVAIDDINVWNAIGTPWPSTANGVITIVPSTGAMDSTVTTNLPTVFRQVKVGSSGFTMSIANGGYTMTYTGGPNETHLLARDANNNVVFDGPIDTEDQRAKLPPEIAPMVQKTLATLPLRVREPSRQPQP